MAKYYNFNYSAGFSGTETNEVVRFSSDVSEDEVQKTFDDWYEEQRRDCGYFEEISKEKAENLGVDEDYSDN